jgi:hypothetical protein
MRKLPFIILSILGAGVMVANAQESPQPPAHQPAATQESTEQQHPEWFRETYKYRPCPADVVFQNGRHACLDGR